MTRLIKFKENLNDKRFWVAVLSELIATCVLVFIGCGSILIHFPGHVVTSSADIIRVSLTFGLTVTVIIAALGPASDCHVNPAVSIGLMFGGKITLFRTFFYVIVQVIGALLGSALLYFVVPNEQRGNLGMTQLANGVEPVQGFITELAMTCILVMVISACVDEGRSDFLPYKTTNAITIGFAITALHLKGVPYTGSSLNPARSFGPAFLNWNWEYHWIYWFGPIIGGIIGATAYRFLLSTHEPVVSVVPEEEISPSSSEENISIEEVRASHSPLLYPPLVPLKRYNNRRKLVLPHDSIESGSSRDSVATKTSALSSATAVSKTSQASKVSSFSLCMAPTPFDHF